MSKLALISLSSILLTTSITVFISQTVLAATPIDLQKSIGDKNNELVNIKNQIQQTQDKLDEVSGQSRTLKQDVKNLDYTLNQLNLGIRLSQVNIEKLTLELESLKDKKVKTEQNIDISKEAIAKVLRELQQKESRSVIEILLKNSSLADGILEIQTLKDLQGSLAVNSAQLSKLSTDLGENIDGSSRKKAEVEIENRNQKNRKAIASDEKESKASLLKQTKDQESLYQKQLKELQGQQDLIADQIDAIEDELRRQLGPGFIPPRITGFFSWPVLLTQFGGAGRITQHYGEKSYLYRGRPHNGLDIGTPAGTLVYAVADGKVARVDNNDRSSWKKYQYGKYIVVDHNNNVSTLYAHLSKQLVREGDMVHRGDIIGYSGKTGYATGPHLHLGVYLTNTLTYRAVGAAAGLVPIGVSLNPEDYL